jgi:hypothetical protein
MPLKASDQQANEMFARHLMPGETLTAYVYGQSGPALWLQALLGALVSFMLSKYYYVGLTNRRLLLLRVSGMFNEKGIESIDFPQIVNVETKWALAGKTLVFTLANGERRKIMVRGRAWGLKHQREYLEQIAGFFQGVLDRRVVV